MAAEKSKLYFDINGKRKIVECKDVFKIYKQGKIEIFALRDLNLTIYEGELVVIVGPSGSGKTTLLHVIAGLERPTAGKITVKDLMMTQLKEKQIEHLLQHEFGIVFQFFNLIPHLTVYGNIELPMLVADKDKIYQKENIKNLLEKVDLLNRAFARPYTLSGGERQRVAIAMAFANNPGIILADEPTGNLDSKSSKKIMQIFHEFNIQNPDKAIIIVTHNPIFRRIANRILVISDGSIIREISKEEFEKNQTKIQNDIFDTESDLSDFRDLDSK
ncbi:MAG: ABC transporter ATP-binding protein [Promethearchaeota archaeon]